MEAVSLQNLRKAIPLSTSQMAMAIGLDGANAADKVREMERGRPISGPIQRVLAYLAQATAAGGRKGDALFHQVVPTWLDCSELGEGSDTTKVVMHTQWPRFYGWIANEIRPELADALKDAGIPIVPMNPKLGMGHLVVFFVDEPVKDTTELLTEAVMRIEARAKRDLI